MPDKDNEAPSVAAMKAQEVSLLLAAHDVGTCVMRLDRKELIDTLIERQRIKWMKTSYEILLYKYLMDQVQHVTEHMGNAMQMDETKLHARTDGTGQYL